MKALKILFADDDLKYSMLLKRFLEAEGYEVTYAGNGRIALEQFPAYVTSSPSASRKRRV